MTVIATTQEVLSKVLAEDLSVIMKDYNFAHGETATEASDVDYVLGQVVVWDTDHWEILKTGVALTGGSTAATANVPLAVVVGFDSLGDEWDETVGSGGRDVVLAYQGPLKIKEANLTFDGGLSAGEVAAAKAQLAEQGMKMVTVADSVASTFYAQ